MQSIDPAKAERVWQRVKGDTPPASPEIGLTELIAQEWTDGAVYLQLARRFQGKDSAILRKMHEEEQAHMACLKGIYTLITGRRPTVKAVPPAQGDPEQILRRAYGREMQSLARYEARSGDPEYGQVFARMAQQEREHCRMILELLGRLNKRDMK